MFHVHCVLCYLHGDIINDGDDDDDNDNERHIFPGNIQLRKFLLPVYSDPVDRDGAIVLKQPVSIIAI